MDSKHFHIKHILPIALIFGLLGGGLLIETPLIFHKGWLLIFSYAIVLIATIYAVKYIRKIEITYLESFITGILTFLLMTYIMYFYVIFHDNPDNSITLWGHAWRFLFSFGMALASSALAALFFRK